MNAARLRQLRCLNRKFSTLTKHQINISGYGFFKAVKPKFHQFPGKDESWEEGTLPHYDPTRVYPIDPGTSIYHGDFKYYALIKIGWGETSTVWLAQRDDKSSQTRELVALKVKFSDIQDAETLATSMIKPGDLSSRYLRYMSNTFEREVDGKLFTILDLELLRESLGRLRARFKKKGVDIPRLPVPELKAYVKQILKGLKVLHNKHHMVHTDLTEDNILMTIEKSTTSPPVHRMAAYLGRFGTKPMRFVKSIKDQNTRIYLSRGNFWRPIHPTKELGLKIADLSSAHLSGNGLHPIQRDEYRAPEVILGTGWSFSADIWNLGLLMWRLLTGKDLFESTAVNGNKYSAKHHLGRMIALLGPPPRKSSIIRKHLSNQRDWEKPYPNHSGVLCDNAYDFYGGPFFNAKGDFLFPELIPRDLKLEDTVVCNSRKERGEFLDFARCMLQWQPEQRGKAGNLLNHPWLEDSPDTPEGEQEDPIVIKKRPLGPDKIAAKARSDALLAQQEKEAADRAAKMKKKRGARPQGRGKKAAKARPSPDSSQAQKDVEVLPATRKEKQGARERSRDAGSTDGNPKPRSNPSRPQRPASKDARARTNPSENNPRDAQSFTRKEKQKAPERSTDAGSTDGNSKPRSNPSRPQRPANKDARARSNPSENEPRDARSLTHKKK